MAATEKLVHLTNLTDVPGPGKNQPHMMDLFNQTLEPGETLRVRAALVTGHLDGLVKGGKLAIGELPEWYKEAKIRPHGVLSKEEAIKRASGGKVPESPSFYMAQDAKAKAEKAEAAKK